mmetsp:Transcript_24447/g.61436  ORF Transcript_24447/g.61436 Transcript_24447/m.61436 type:complete len:664 (+) Transcript_24447:241-2232(+)
MAPGPGLHADAPQLDRFDPELGTAGEAGVAEGVADARVAKREVLVHPDRKVAAPADRHAVRRGKLEKVVALLGLALPGVRHHVGLYLEHKGLAGAKVARAHLPGFGVEAAEDEARAVLDHQHGVRVADRAPVHRLQADAVLLGAVRQLPARLLVAAGQHVGQAVDVSGAQQVGAPQHLGAPLPLTQVQRRDDLATLATRRRRLRGRLLFRRRLAAALRRQRAAAPPKDERRPGVDARRGLLLVLLQHRALVMHVGARVLGGPALYLLLDVRARLGGGGEGEPPQGPAAAARLPEDVPLPGLRVSQRAGGAAAGGLLLRGDVGQLGRSGSPITAAAAAPQVAVVRGLAGGVLPLGDRGHAAPGEPRQAEALSRLLRPRRRALRAAGGLWRPGRLAGAHAAAAVVALALRGWRAGGPADGRHDAPQPAALAVVAPPAAGALHLGAARLVAPALLPLHLLDPDKLGGRDAGAQLHKLKALARAQQHRRHLALRREDVDGVLLHEDALRLQRLLAVHGGVDRLGAQRPQWLPRLIQLPLHRVQPRAAQHRAQLVVLAPQASLAHLRHLQPRQRGGQAGLQVRHAPRQVLLPCQRRHRAHFRPARSAPSLPVYLPGYECSRPGRARLATGRGTPAREALRAEGTWTARGERSRSLLLGFQVLVCLLGR